MNVLTLPPQPCADVPRRYPQSSLAAFMLPWTEDWKLDVTVAGDKV